MQTGVLLSIKPQFTRSIFSGLKKYEYRKAIFTNKNINRIYVYASKPIGMVIGEFEIDEILASSPECLWKRTKRDSGISKDYFDEYFNGRDIAYALKVGETILYNRPKTLKELCNIDRPPQSFMYVF